MNKEQLANSDKKIVSKFILELIAQTNDKEQLNALWATLWIVEGKTRGFK